VTILRDGIDVGSGPFGYGVVVDDVAPMVPEIRACALPASAETPAVVSTIASPRSPARRPSNREIAHVPNSWSR
jgi:hypothetical protein